ncbi:MAG: DUF1579 family protein [Phycisphaerales bacterium]|nr:DUF1579 family protein [Phycisphaerales bacterium]
MKTRWLWVMLAGGGICVIGGCASHDGSTAVAEGDGSSDVYVDESGEGAPEGVWQPDSGRTEATAPATQPTRTEAPATTMADATPEPVSDPEWDPAWGDQAEWDAMAEGMGMTGAEMMAMVMQYGTPGEHHQRMQQFVGDWNIKSTMWMTPDQSMGKEDTGTSHFRSILGGRYFTEELSMGQGAELFEGFCIYGYDRRIDKHFFTWADSWGTGLMHGEGDCDGEGKVFTYYSSYEMPGMPKTQYKSVTTIVNPRMYIFEMFTQGPDGQYWQNMELVYTRR